MDRKIIDYIFVDLRYLEYNANTAICDLMKDGYQPYGYPVTNGERPVQAMVKYEESQTEGKNDE